MCIIDIRECKRNLCSTKFKFKLQTLVLCTNFIRSMGQISSQMGRFYDQKRQKVHGMNPPLPALFIKSLNRYRY